MTSRLSQPELQSQLSWEKALQTLPQDVQSNLPMVGSSKSYILESLVIAVEEAQKTCNRRQWKIKRDDGRVIVVRDIMEKVLRAVQSFKEIGDVAVQFDPTHAALPWAGIRLLLQARFS